jgi:hypothetical protein
MQDAFLFAGRNAIQGEARIGKFALRFLIDGPAFGASVTIFEMSLLPAPKSPCAVTTHSTRASTALTASSP